MDRRSHNKTVLFLIPYPLGVAASQRFRFEHFFPYLKENNIEISAQSFIDEQTWSVLYKKGFTIRKIAGVLRGFLRRLWMLFSLHKYDLVFIHRETLPIGPPVIEWIISRVLGKKYIYDFDDAIWLANTSDSNRAIAGLKWHHKVGSICRWACKVSAGNDYLADFARKFNPEVYVIPTVVETDTMHSQIHEFNPDGLTVGWTGTHSTISYLNDLVPVLKEVYAEKPFNLLVISDRRPDFDFPTLQFKPWSKHTEIEDLNRIDIGIMPLEDDPWSKGKCGFKAIQYMSLGIPALVSPVGVNTTIVTPGVNGYWCPTHSDWKAMLLQLLSHPEELAQLGKNARQTIVEDYSVATTKEKFLRLFS